MFKPTRPILLSLAAALALTPPLLSRSAAAITLTQPVSEGDLKKLITPAIIPGALELNTATAEVGKTITIRGYIAKGSLAADRAEFTLTPSPSEPSPACVVRIADASGKPMTGSLEGKSGLRPGAEVFVTGRVESADKPLTLVATSMHIPRSPLPPETFTDQPATAAKDISEARKAGGFKVGDEITLRGRIGGSKDPFVPAAHVHPRRPRPQGLQRERGRQVPPPVGLLLRNQGSHPRQLRLRPVRGRQGPGPPHGYEGPPRPQRAVRGCHRRQGYDRRSQSGCDQRNQGRNRPVTKNKGGHTFARPPGGRKREFITSGATPSPAPDGPGRAWAERACRSCLGHAIHTAGTSLTPHQSVRSTSIQHFSMPRAGHS